MNGMIETIQDAIIDQLKTIDGVVTCEAWQGDIEDLLKTPQRLPALRVIFQTAVFDAKDTIGGDQPAMTLSYLIVLVAKHLKSREEGANLCYSIIEAARNLLIGHKVSGYDFLWPKQEDLIMAEGGTLVYGMTYSMYTILTMP